MADVIYTAQAKTCPCCTRRYMSGIGCSWNAIRVDGEYRERIRFGEERWRIAGDRCPTCSVAKGEYHHAGCDYEESPFYGLDLKAFNETAAPPFSFSKVKQELLQENKENEDRCTIA